MFATWLLKHDGWTHRPELVVLQGLISAGTLLAAFNLKAVGFEPFWITFILGFGVVPLLAPWPTV